MADVDESDWGGIGLEVALPSKTAVRRDESGEARSEKTAVENILFTKISRITQQCSKIGRITHEFRFGFLEIFLNSDLNFLHTPQPDGLKVFYVLRVRTHLPAGWP